MFAWSNFTVERNEYGQPTRVIKPGEKITQKDLDVGDADWQAFIDAGAIREESYPEDLPSHVSPAERKRAEEKPKSDRSGELMLPKAKTQEVSLPESTSVLDRAIGLG